MNIKYLIALFLVSYVPLPAMAPGTVIDPINHNGQFTVNAVPQVNTGNSAHTLCAATHDICKIKGIPVLIAMTASEAPWWALTTGTGYLLICQTNICNPLLLHSIAAGSSYAMGQKATEAIKKLFHNPKLLFGSHAALFAGCLITSYLSASPCIDGACFAGMQAIGLQSLMEACAYFLPKIKSAHSSKQPSSQSHSSSVGNGIIDGTVEALEMLTYSGIASLLQNSDPLTLLQILLYEQAYRLADVGCQAAQQLIDRTSNISK